MLLCMRTSPCKVNVALACLFVCAAPSAPSHEIAQAMVTNDAIIHTLKNFSFDLADESQRPCCIATNHKLVQARVGSANLGNGVLKMHCLPGWMFSRSIILCSHWLQIHSPYAAIDISAL